jgi:hypothetical protein
VPANEIVGLAPGDLRVSATGKQDLASVSQTITAM